MQKVLLKGNKGVVLNTFLFLILTFLLVFAVFVIIAPSISIFYTIWGQTQSQIDVGMYGNVTNSTKQLIDANENVKSILPYLVIFAFVLTVLIYGAYTELQKSGG
jgi:hypothetical protein